MEFSVFLLFSVWTSSMTYLTFGKERERAMVFPDYYFFAERRLVNHTIDEKRVKNLDDCELFCYLTDDCVSLNYKKYPENDKTGYNCQLNNATHLKHDSDFTTDAKFYYRGSKNACDKTSLCQNNATCQSGFTFKGYRCLCPPGFVGEHCENDTDKCKAFFGKCHKEATCINTHGSHVCVCKPGYIGDGHNCIDIDECRETPADKIKQCHPNASCINTQGSYNCSCNPNYIGDGFNCKADPCIDYNELSDSNRKSSYKTPHSQELCDDQLPVGWYRFVGAAGTQMATIEVGKFHCGTDFPGWLNDHHPTMEEGEKSKKVCFTGSSKGCIYIGVKNCGSFYIYNIIRPPGCSMRYCGSG